MIRANEPGTQARHDGAPAAHQDNRGSPNHCV